MPPAPKPIPQQLRHSAFRTAEAAGHGASEGMLRGSRFVRLHQGVHAVKSRPDHQTAFVEQRALAAAQDYAPLLRPGEAFSHTTALYLYGTPIEAKPDIHTTIAWPHAPAKGRNIHGHRTRTPFDSRRRHSGLACVPPKLALLQCAELLPFRELVVAIDHLLLPRRELGGQAYLDRAELEEYLQRASVPGVGRLRAACEVARVGAESRYETLTRFELARMGLDDLELQVDLFLRTGEWIGRFDLVDRVKRKIVEYDGEQHRTDRKQYLKDVRRLKLAEREDYKVLRLHAENFRPSALEHTRKELCEFLNESPRPVPAHLARYFAEPLVRR